MVFPDQRPVRRGRDDIPPDTVVPRDDAREGSPRHAWKHDKSRIIALQPGQVRRGRGHVPADVAAPGDGAWERSPRHAHEFG